MHSHFEIFLEDLFYSVVTDRSGISECLPHVVFQDREQANLILFNSRNYVDWMPYKEGIRKISRLAFKSGSPFERLERQQYENEVLAQFTDLRNAIAHQSRYSLRKIERLTSTMRPRRRNPAGFLQSRSSGVSNFSAYATDIRVIAAALASSDISSAKQRLSPEEPYKASAQPGRGIYECARCGTTRTMRSSTSQIGLCKVCRRRNLPQLGWRRKYS
jgi:hypothetical protein